MQKKKGNKEIAHQNEAIEEKESKWNVRNFFAVVADTRLIAVSRKDNEYLLDPVVGEQSEAKKKKKKKDINKADALCVSLVAFFLSRKYVSVHSISLYFFFFSLISSSFVLLFDELCVSNCFFSKRFIRICFKKFSVQKRNELRSTFNNCLFRSNPVFLFLLSALSWHSREHADAILVSLSRREWDRKWEKELHW